MSDAATPDAALTGIYLYCLARTDCLATVQELAAQKGLGVDPNYGLAALPNSGVVAVISEVLLSEFSEANLQDLSWLGERAMRHEAVVARIMAASPVLPVKFGTLYRTRDSLKQFMDQNHQPVDQALEQLRDKAEWSVKGYLADAVARKSTDVQLSLPYKLAYGSEILQGPEGARFGPKLMILLIQFPVVERGSSYTFGVAELTSAGASFPSFEPGYSFRLAGGALDIYKL